jgi:two-component system, chemotaxis family, protein-glutamate methylesterase/glutaminase
VDEEARLVVIGASAGGVTALRRLAADLAPDFPAPILVVLHIGAHKSVLPELMNSRGALKAVFAADGTKPEAGFIYVAPPDQHLILADGELKLLRGPKENHARPAIDPLFRSAALDYGSRAIGVVLTGKLDDGTAGLLAVQACGGTTVVQDPDDAEEPDMPLSAIAAMRIDHVLPLDKMAAHLKLLAQPQPVGSAVSVPDFLKAEHAASLGKASMKQLGKTASPSGLSCPDCGGTLFELGGGKSPRYRCHTGHAFGLRSLLAAQEEATDQALWGAVRALHEKEAILRNLARKQAELMPGSEAQTCEQADELRAFAERMQALVLEAPVVLP